MDSENDKSLDRGLAGVFAQMMYGEAGPPKLPVQPDQPKNRFVAAASTTLVVAAFAAIMFSLVMGCIAIFQAVLG